MAIIEIKNISKSFVNINNISILMLLFNINLDLISILENISFNLNKGQFLGIIGKNGATLELSSKTCLLGF